LEARIWKESYRNRGIVHGGEKCTVLSKGKEQGGREEERQETFLDRNGIRSNLKKKQRPVPASDQLSHMQDK